MGVKFVLPVWSPPLGAAGEQQLSFKFSFHKKKVPQTQKLSDLRNSSTTLAMMTMSAMKLIPTLEPRMAPASDLQSPKELHRHTVTLTWAKTPRTGLPESDTSTVTTYSPSSSSTRGWRTAWVPGGGVGQVESGWVWRHNIHFVEVNMMQTT